MPFSDKMVESTLGLISDFSTDKHSSFGFEYPCILACYFFNTQAHLLCIFNPSAICSIVPFYVLCVLFEYVYGIMQGFQILVGPT